ncbi:MAG: hypothetical protein HKN37_17660 [Rhodothermales bacterium]|nr:hypothetical protein [Rhodothermales bacterium]
MSEPERRVPDGDASDPTISSAAFRDRVVRAAFSDGIVSREQIIAEWDAFVAEPTSKGTRFWRFLANRQRAGREAIYALAARTYGFDEVGISVSDVIAVVRGVTSRFNRKEWETMSRLRILPIGFEDAGDGEQGRMLFACSDPTRMEVNSFLSRLSSRSFVLHYAAANSIDYVLDRVLPVLLSKGEGTTSNRVFEPNVRLVPLDPLRDIMEERKGFRRAA